MAQAHTACENSIFLLFVVLLVQETDRQTESPVLIIMSSFRSLFVATKATMCAFCAGRASTHTIGGSLQQPAALWPATCSRLCH